jgi:cob(I)alamin adenosyltransferase
LKIYTGFGDSGRTRLYGGKIVDKDDLRVDTYGTADELNSYLGFVIAYLREEEWVDFLQNIQQDIFKISSELATPSDKKKQLSGISITLNDIEIIENNIDKVESGLKPLKNFILPGGTREAALLHLARTVCRRLERRLISLHKQVDLDQNILVYINRLSDFLFVFARYMNKKSGCDDIAWINKS